MATLVEEQSIDNLPSLTPEEAKAKCIVNYFDKTQKGADENSIWDNYQKYTGSYQWIFPDGVWAQMGVYLNKMDQYAPKLQSLN